MQQEFDRAGPVLHYTQAWMAQMVQTAACNQHHSLDQQLCRGVIAESGSSAGYGDADDQDAHRPYGGVTQDIATQGALKLQDAGLIDYRHGRIRVLDRIGLEKRSCECYAVVKEEYDRLLPLTLAA
jgi:hypothetical protein